MRLHVRLHNKGPTAENIVSGFDKRIFGCAWLSVTRICVLKFVVEVRKGAAGYAVYKVSKLQSLGFLAENCM